MPSKAAGIETYYAQMYIQCSSLALLYYDYLLTFPDEIELIWRSRFTLSTFLYIWCRYALVANLVFLLAFLRIIGGSCDKGYLISGALSIIGRLSILGAWGLRTYAVYGRSRIILAWFVTLGLASFISDIIHVIGNRCQGNVRFPTSGRFLSVVVCCFEFSATVLTVARCFQIMRASGKLRSQRRSYAYLLAEQGILYTVAVSGFTIGSTVLNFRFSGGFLQRLLNALTLPLSGLTTARFLLHLRKWSRKGVFVSSGGLPSDVIFARTPSTFISEFGEDPVQSARREARNASISEGLI